MSGKKTESSQPVDQNKKERSDEKTELKVKNGAPTDGAGFKVSEQEEIEYLQEEREGQEALCATDREPGEDQPELKETINKLQAELERKDREISELKKAVEELKDKFLRSVAELDNIRKRTEREKEEFFQYALSDLLRDILPILDNFERALKTSEEEVDGKTFREGVELIYRMLLNLVKKHGVRPIELEDNKFDPSLHHALVSEESAEVSEPEIKEELQKGYLLHNRLLRPTMVKVIIPKKN
ncbi:MAG: nucleotide exchange factor GrpE [Candidatus Saccharicenans sp.]|jgi:molecular chaperone GrpE|nr:nucleotide exchange factor GrpE [Candidatus Saccharicenans sp.]MDH7574179.1 nucleotide exchange factor GrpE [Candidatus Saccharicenans sp.]